MKWEIVELGQIAETTSGGTPSRTKPENWDGAAIPWVKSGELRDCYINSSEEFITEVGLKNSSAKLFAPGTLLLALYGATAGKLGILGFPATTNQAVCGITPKSSILHTKYLYHFLLSKRGQIIKDSFGGAQPNISQGYVRKLRVPVPPLSVQQHIAETLDKADALRSKDQQLLRKYDELAQSIFYEMFGDPVENTKGWLVKPLGELTRKITDGTHQTPTYVESGVPFLRVTDLTESSTSKKFITREEHLILTKRCKPERGDVLYSKNGTIGVAKVVDWDYDFSIFVSLCLLKVKTEVLNPKFLEFFLNTPFALNQAKKHSKTGTVTNLHLNEIKNILVPVPDYSTQERFLRAVTSIEAQKNLVRYSEGLFETVLNSHF